MSGRGKPIGPTEADQALRLIREGKTWAEIAKMVGRSASGLSKALKETWPDELAEAQDARNDIIRNEVWTLRQSEDAATKRWAYDHLIKWHLPEAKETQKLEVTGNVQVAHEARLTLAHALALGRVEGLGGSAGGVLPAARDVLAEAPEGERPAGTLPPGSE